MVARLRNLSLALVIGAAMLLPYAAAAACDPVLKLSHPKWFRLGGYCEIVSDLRQHDDISHSGGSGRYPTITRIVDLDYNGWHYHDNGGGVWTVDNGADQYTYVYAGDGTHTVTKTR